MVVGVAGQSRRRPVVWFVVIVNRAAHVLTRRFCVSVVVRQLSRRRGAIVRRVPPPGRSWY